MIVLPFPVICEQFMDKNVYINYSYFINILRTTYSDS